MRTDKRYDNDFQKIEELLWLPWVGPEYYNSKKKLLIVGNSHYVTMKEVSNYKNENQTTLSNKNFTREVINEDVIEGDYRYVTYANLERTLLNDDEIHTKLWEHICFYNLIQRPLCNDQIKHTIEQPKVDDYTRGWEILFKVINIIKPDQCIILGVTAFDNLNQIFSAIEIKKSNPINRCRMREATLRTNSKQIKLIGIKHPGRFYSSIKWKNFLKEKGLWDSTFLE